jgi:hypothetical protein
MFHLRLRSLTIHMRLYVMPNEYDMYLDMCVFFDPCDWICFGLFIVSLFDCPILILFVSDWLRITSGVLVNDVLDLLLPCNFVVLGTFILFVA